MKSFRINLVSATLGLLTLLTPSSSFAGAVAVDSRTAGIGGWGVARADEETPSRQLQLAIDRAIRYGGSATYIRAYQFTVPKGCYASLAIGVVSGKGWAGNWGYGATPAEAECNARAGMVRQSASQISVVRTWQE
ncbi:MAG: hypothetical protein IT581_08900 [Verrucomicrobiales bacterium]|nr:hypothetical protein [Verrucomicrobiales bacterium]